MKGERLLTAAVVRWWFLVTDKAASEKARGEAYVAMTRELEKVTGRTR